ncbi:MAG: hypothetical protein NTY48_03300 [Candidatus Diapherotrites archaeon]|nr:hypothetical protein [Candidatus Diapherotrites archaeon]
MENASEWKLRTPSGEAKNAFEELEQNTSKIEEEKKALTEFIEKEMTSEFPNFSALATPVLGAKLLASAGSKKRLCFMPASTIQVLGAEKALFAHMRNNAKSPKHGHLFNHPLMQKLPRFRRGKVARIIAGKLSIALKQDYFGGENTSSKVMKELAEKIGAIFNEPITQKQERKEQELIEQHTERTDTTLDSEKTRTWTHEERKAYFAKQNKPGEWKRQPKPNIESRQFGPDVTPRRELFKPQERQFSAPEQENEHIERKAFGEKEDFEAKKNFTPEKRYGGGEKSFGSGRSYSERKASGERRFGIGKPYGGRGGFGAKKRFTGKRFSDQGSTGFGEERKSRGNFGGERRERIGFSENRGPRRENPYGSRTFTPRENKFAKPGYHKSEHEGTSQAYGRTKSASFGKGRFNKPRHSEKRY